MPRPLARLAAALPVLSLLLVAAPAAAQEQEPAPSLLYEAYFRINFADLPEWTRQFDTYSVPILREMQSEGLIEGWGHWQHNTGGEYDVRLALRLYDWDDIDTFWNEYLAGMAEAVPADEQAATSHMIEAHYDEVWNIGTVNVQQGAATPYMYASTFQVNFGDVEAWDGFWQENVLPVLQDAMDAGVLAGVVTLNHNTGLPHNKKVLYMFEEWDDMDDMWNMFFERMETEHGEAFAESLSLVQAHDDIIWAAPPPSGNQ
ncbi:MAG: hypothetical protein PVI57_09105 [Gemmatimonadota bacterium]|jgi:hypothetical protein